MDPAAIVQRTSSTVLSISCDLWYPICPIRNLSQLHSLHYTCVWEHPLLWYFGLESLHTNASFTFSSAKLWCCVLLAGGEPTETFKRSCKSLVLRSRKLSVRRSEKQCCMSKILPGYCYFENTPHVSPRTSPVYCVPDNEIAHSNQSLAIAGVNFWNNVRVSG